MPRKRTRVDSASAVAKGGSSEEARSTSRRWKGVLESFPNMPLDLMDEVLKHLSPLDLLHLARTTKSFRSLVLAKNAAGVWRAARRSIPGLPDCPPYMSEPAYANLMFSPHCHRCFAGNIQNIILPFLVRYCNNCKKSQCVESYLLGGRGGYGGGLTDDMFCTVSGDRRRPLYHKPDVESIWEKWLTLPQDETVRERYKQEVRERVRLVTQHSALCAAFVERKRASRAEELRTEKKQKLDLVIERLVALGWGGELEEMKQSGYYEIREHNGVRQLKRVNNKTWADIEKSLVNLMKTCKKSRLVMQRRQQIKDRLVLLTSVLRQHFPALRRTTADFGPQFVDFAVMPDIRRITEAPSSRTITDADFVGVKNQLMTLTNDWLVQAVTQLSSVISFSLPFHDGLSALLASAFFDCTACGRRGMQYPAVCAHECLRSRYYRGLDTNDSAYLYLDTTYAVGCVRHWSCQSLAPSPSIERAKEVVEVCGEDPNTIQQSHMDESPHRLCCKTCSRAGVKLVMNWRCAVEHWRIAHSNIDDDKVEWEKVSDAEAEKAAELEEINFERALDDHVTKIHWSCARCVPYRNGTMSLSIATDHVRIAHQVATPTAAAGDLYINGDSPPFISRPVLLISHELHNSDLTSAEKKYYKEGGGCSWDFGLIRQQTYIS